MDYYTIDELARKLKLHEETIRRLIRKEKFPRPIKFGRSARWSDDQLEDYSRRQRTQEAPGNVS